MHPRDHGGLGTPDRDVLKRCFDHDLVLVTENARDIRALIATQAIHPGLIVLPCVGRARSEKLLRAVIDFLSERGEAMASSITPLQTPLRGPVEHEQPSRAPYHVAPADTVE